MTKLFVGALAVLSLGLAACGDTRSNRDLNGVATWPAGGAAHGAWNEPPPATYSYGSTTTTTTTVYPGTTTTTVYPGTR